MYFSFQYSGGIFYKTIILLVLVGYGMNMANSAQRYSGRDATVARSGRQKRKFKFKNPLQGV